MAVASRLDTGRAFTKVILPAPASGVVVRRHAAAALAVATMKRYPERYGPEPLRLRVTGRSVALLLDPLDVARPPADSPSPFALATLEKKAALKHFQPYGVLISTWPERVRRARWTTTCRGRTRPTSGGSCSGRSPGRTSS